MWSGSHTSLVKVDGRLPGPGDGGQEIQGWSPEC